MGQLGRQLRAEPPAGRHDNYGRAQLGNDRQHPLQQLHRIELALRRPGADLVRDRVAVGHVKDRAQRDAHELNRVGTGTLRLVSFDVCSHRLVPGSAVEPFGYGG